MKIFLVVLLLFCITGCKNEKQEEEFNENEVENKVDYINVLCEDLEIEIMNYENGDTTKKELIGAIKLAKTDCDEDRGICNLLKKEIKDNMSDKELTEYIKEIEKSCHE